MHVQACLQADSCPLCCLPACLPAPDPGPWTLRCPAADQVQLKVSSAASATDSFKATTLTVKIATSCQCECLGGGGSSSSSSSSKGMAWLVACRVHSGSSRSSCGCAAWYTDPSALFLPHAPAGISRGPPGEADTFVTGPGSSTATSSPGTISTVRRSTNAAARAPAGAGLLAALAAGAAAVLAL
jgi:hypothetical protein